MSAEDRAALVNVLKEEFQSISGNYMDILETLSPAAKMRVELLREIQKQHDELVTKFFEERTAFEAKYQKLYEPLHAKRYEIVNGAVEVEGIKGESHDDAHAENSVIQEKGMPGFWLYVMKTNEVLAEEIQERDEEALKYLKDIKWSRIDDPKGFKLEFFFDSNPYFKNTILAKTYKMIDQDEPNLDKAVGTDIEWFPEKCLTRKILKKKPKKGSKNAKPIMKTENCESFFNFFNPPQVPDTDNEAHFDEEIDEQLQDQMKIDYDIEFISKDKIIPRAVSCFTGEAVKNDYIEIDDEDCDEDEEENEEDEDEDEEGDEDEEKCKFRNRSTGQKVQ